MNIPRYGLGIPNISFDKQTKPTLKWLANYSMLCEKQGVGAIWLMDHIYWHLPTVEQIISLATIGAVTSKAFIGSGITQLPLRHGSLNIIGKQIENIADSAEDRLIIGLGLGSVPQEYLALGIDFNNRRRTFEEDFLNLKRTLKHGFQYASKDRMQIARVEKSRTSVPFWFGMRDGEKALNLVAKYANGWMPLFVTPSEYSHAKHRIQELMVNSYRRNDKMSFGISLLVNMGDPDQLNINAERFSNLFGLPYEYFRKYVIKGSLEECADQISEFLEIEIDHVSLLFPTSDPLSDFLKLQNRLG